MFSRLSSYSDFNKRLNAEFVKGIPSPSESVFTDKNMELDTPWLGNLSPYKRDVFGLDLSDGDVDSNSFSVDSRKFARIIAIEGALKNFDENAKYYRQYDISKDDVVDAENVKFNNYVNR